MGLRGVDILSDDFWWANIKYTFLLNQFFLRFCAMYKTEKLILIFVKWIFVFIT